MPDGAGHDGQGCDEQLVEQLASLLRAATRTWVLSGAGMSTESGLPDYRGESGLWRNRRFEELASLDALREEPAEFWEFYRLRLDHLGAAKPNGAHLAVARLEDAGLVDRVVTQNVDGLHQEAGSRGVLELHGSLRVARCRRCGLEVAIDETRARWAREADFVPRCDCGAVLGPGVVLFGEPLPLAIDIAFEVAGSCDVVLALGTSLEVFPAAHLPLVTIERGGRLAIVNRGRTQFDELAHLRVDSRLGDVVPRVADRLLSGDR